jgi:hypothetical protein
MINHVGESCYPSGWHWWWCDCWMLYATELLQEAHRPTARLDQGIMACPCWLLSIGNGTTNSIPQSSAAGFICNVMAGSGRHMLGQAIVRSQGGL